MNAWLKAQPPAIQSLVYAIETGVAAAVAIFLAALYAALTGPHGLDGFDWHGQLHTLELAAAAAVVKAAFDFIKGNKPTQVATGGPA